jgi:hypothetical protein
MLEARNYLLREESLITNYQTAICFLLVAHYGVNGKESNGTITIKDGCSTVNA